MGVGMAGKKYDFNRWPKGKTPPLEHPEEYQWTDETFAQYRQARYEHRHRLIARKRNMLDQIQRLEALLRHGPNAMQFRQAHQKQKEQQIYETRSLYHNGGDGGMWEVNADCRACS